MRPKLPDDYMAQAVQYMWAYGLTVAKTKYQVTAQCLYNWRDDLIERGVITKPTAEETATRIKVKPQAAEILTAELEESDHSPVAYVQEILQTRMRVLQRMNNIIPRTKSLRDLNDCLRALNEGYEIASVASPLSKMEDKKSMWEATEIILNHRKEIEESQQRVDQKKLT